MSGHRPSVDDFVAAGIYEPGESRRGRLELLEWLADRGFTVEQMVEAECTDAIGSVAGDHRLVPGERLTRAEAISRVGLSAGDFDALVAALGFRPIQGAPDGEVGFTPDELESLARFGRLETFFSHAESLALLRTLGSSVARIAEAGVSMFLAEVESPHVLAGESELELAHKVYDAVGIVDGLAPALDPLIRRQMLQAIERTRRTMVDDTDRFRFRYAIGFVDLVGFTALSAGMKAEELAVFLREFEARAHHVAHEHRARIVKLIGDEVMFVAEGAADACQAGSALMEGFSFGTDQVVPRGGAAYGDVLPRGGDYYGTVVNLASRLVGEAVPRELLVTDELAQAAVGCVFEPAGRRMVKGFAEPVTVRSLVSAGDRP